MKSFVVLSFSACLLIASAAPQFNWSAQPNNRGNGLNLGGSYSHQVGTPNHNVAGSVFGSGALNSGNSLKLQDKTYGAGVNYHNNGHGIGYKHTETDRFRNDAVRGTLNLYDNGRSQVNVNAWGDRTRPKRQFNHVDQYGGNVEWKHVNGHSASLGTNNIPQLKQQTIDANANVNLWRNKQSSLDAYGQGTRYINDINKRRPEYSTGIRFTHRF